MLDLVPGNGADAQEWIEQPVQIDLGVGEVPGGGELLDFLAELAPIPTPLYTMVRYTADFSAAAPDLGVLHEHSAKRAAKAIKKAWASGFGVRILFVSDRGGEAPSDVGFSGDDLLALLGRPKPEPIFAGIPVASHFNLLLGAPFAGKTSLCLWTGMSRAAGVAPWDGAPKLEPGPVLFLSLDEGAEQAARRMNGLALFHPAGRLQRYAEQITVIGPDRDTDTAELERFRLDESGLEHLRDLIGEHHYAEVYLDAYADFLPLGASENANEEGTRIGGGLERIAVETGTAIQLLHHSGHRAAANTGEEQMEVRLLARGCTALAAKARVVTAVEAVKGLANLRQLRAQTNLGPAPKAVLLEVADKDARADELTHFQAHDLIGAYKPEDYLEPGEPISTHAFGRLLAGLIPGDSKEPSGVVIKLAMQLRDEWAERRLIKIEKGDRGAKNLVLPGGKDG